MRLDSVRSLKDDLRGFAKFAALSGLFEVAGSPDSRSPPSGVALGIAPGPRRNDWRLALRLTRHTPATARFVQLASQRSRGELDAQFVGSIRAPRSAVGGVPELVTRARPLFPGVSIGHLKSTAGTLGAFAYDGERRLVVLSNNHVLCAGGCAPGDAIVQPGPIDGGGLAARDMVATLKNWGTLDTAVSNPFDAATAELIGGVRCLPSYGERPLAGSNDGPVPGLSVWKIGRTTGYTRGYVRAVEVDGIEVAYGRQLVTFDNQLEIAGLDRAFSDGGDSGSLILDDASQAVGLLFAGSPSTAGAAAVTYANPIVPILEAFGLELI